MQHNQNKSTSSHLAEGPFVVVGAGVAGLAVATLLAKAGHQVLILERRSKEEIIQQSFGKSINFTISKRGLNVLNKIDLLNDVQEYYQPLEGREIHELAKPSSINPYSQSGEKTLFSICRRDLITILLKRTMIEKNISCRFNCDIKSIDRENAQIVLNTKDANEIILAKSIIGSDGAFSVVRREMIKGLPISFSQDFFNWSYREIELSIEAVKNLKLDINRLHVYPGLDALFLGIPNKSGSITGLLLINKDKLVGSQLNQFLAKQFPELVNGQIDFLAQVSQSNQSWLTTISLSQWYYKNKIVLVGDACHAVYPFYGQGMNCALEDAYALSELIGTNKDNLQAAYAGFQASRKKEADCLQELSSNNFNVFVKKSLLVWTLSQSRVHKILLALIPQIWKNEHELVAEGTLPYSAAKRVIDLQTSILKKSGLFILDVVVELFCSQVAASDLAVITQPI
jgi:kynurenine 3-monooxygenase